LRNLGTQKKLKISDKSFCFFIESKTAKTIISSTFHLTRRRKKTKRENPENKNDLIFKTFPKQRKPLLVGGGQSKKNIYIYIIVIHQKYSLENKTVCMALSCATLRAVEFRQILLFFILTWVFRLGKKSNFYDKNFFLTMRKMLKRKRRKDFSFFW
jgi:hypothetical protein